MTSHLSYRKIEFGAKCNFSLFFKEKKEKKRNCACVFSFFHPCGYVTRSLQTHEIFFSLGERKARSTRRDAVSVTKHPGACVQIFFLLFLLLLFTVWQRATGVYVYPLFPFLFFLFSFKIYRIFFQCQQRQKNIGI